MFFLKLCKTMLCISKNSTKITRLIKHNLLTDYIIYRRNEEIYISMRAFLFPTFLCFPQLIRALQIQIRSAHIFFFGKRESANITKI